MKDLFALMDHLCLDLLFVLLVYWPRLELILRERTITHHRLLSKVQNLNQAR